MFQDMVNMEVSCIVYVKVGTFTCLEQSKIYLLTINKTVIVRLTVPHGSIVSVSFMYYRRDCLRQTSVDALSLKQRTINN
jgi:hypothetical protein